MKEYEDLSYKTLFGNTITLSEYFTEKHKGYFIASCDRCSSDLDLFPYGTIKVSRQALRNQSCVCACNPKYKFSKEQNTVRILRRCEELGYEFKGYSEDYKGANTRLKLYNPSTKNLWCSASVQTFLLVGVKDPEEKAMALKERNTLPDNYHIEKFFSTGNFQKGTVFTRVSTSRWVYTCPVCSEDIYAKNGVCSGTFSSSTGHLGNGKLSCRCSNRYRWSQEERELDIHTVMEENGWKFNGWKEGRYRNQYSDFSWECEKGHENTTSYLNFIKRRSCKTCSANGFKTHLPAFLYLVLWDGDKDNPPFIKYGITNLDVNLRIKSQAKVTNYCPSTLRIFQGDGLEVFNCESALKKLFPSGFISKSLFPRGFTETIPYNKDNLSRVLEIISTFSLQPSDTHLSHQDEGESLSF